MKLTTIIGVVVAAVGLAACGATVSPTASPTIALSVAPTPTAPPTSTPSPSESPATSASASPSPTEGPCGYAPCASGASVGTRCDPGGSGGGGSIVITWTAGVGQTAPVPPATVVIDGNTVDVTGNPFIFGPLAVGDHTVLLNDFTFPANVSACPKITLTATCSDANSPTATLTFSGVTVGDYLNVGESTNSTLITSNPFVVTEAPAGSETWVETSGETTVASGTDSVATCAA